MAVQTAFDFSVLSPPRRGASVAPVGAAAAAHASTPVEAPIAAAAVDALAPLGDVVQEAVRTRSLLERRLGDLLRRPVSLTLTDNERTMISSRRRGNLEHVRLHHMFVEADEPIVRALAAFLGKGDKVASQHLERFVAQRRGHIRTRPKRPAQLAADGNHHDLDKIFDYLNARYFSNGVDADIGWGRRGRAPGKRSRRRSIKLGSYRMGDATIRVHPVLDAAWVPEFFVEYVVYHEMLHQVVGIAVEDGRRKMHGPQFRERERGYARYDEATAWERNNLERLLSS